MMIAYKSFTQRIPDDAPTGCRCSEHLLELQRLVKAHHQNAAKSTPREGHHMLSRRTFLAATAGAGLASATEYSERALAQTPARRMIVDSQVHLWLAEAADRRWPADGPGRAHLPYPFTYDKLVPMMDEAGVDRVVIVPPSWEGERNDYALEAAKKFPSRFGVMGRILLNDPQAPGRLATWKQQPGMLGVRHTFNGAQTNWLTDGTADWFWPAAAKLGIPVMTPTSGRPKDFLRVVERNPELIFIIDHMGLSEDIAKAGKLPEAVGDTIAFSKHPNVSVKMSSVPHKSSEPYPFSDVSDHLKRVFDAFGPRRCFWGTDLTAGIAKFPYTYRQRVTHFTETLAFLSEEDKNWVMGRAIMTRLSWA
jgi:predicted TIM-barrel fold metal-dependent hydrolase